VTSQVGTCPQVSVNTMPCALTCRIKGESNRGIVIILESRIRIKVLVEENF
jgi:hypothetical protein